MADNNQNNMNEQELSKNEGRVIDEAKYSNVQLPKKINTPSVKGKGGDPLFMNVRATKAQLEELLDETTTVQDWIQRETSNNVALACLNKENLKEVYFEIKDGFGEYGPIILMGFKNPQGIEIPRLKILDKNGEVIEVLTGPMAIEELNKRALAYKNSQSAYEILDLPQEENTGVIADYSGNSSDYS